MTPCEATSTYIYGYDRIVSETAHKASVPEDHKPRWESTDRRAFVSKKLRDSIMSRIIDACYEELGGIDNPFHPVSGQLVDYCAVRYYVDDARANFRESVNVVFYGKLGEMYIIWLTRNFPTFDIFGCKRQFNDWTRYEIYISENEMSDLIKVENRIRCEVGRFLDTFMSIENSDRKEEKKMGERTHEEIVARFKSFAMANTDDKKFKYKKIIYSNGVTTVLWEDGTKTTVRAAEGETPDPGAGIAYAFMKKALGNKNAHNKILRKEVPAMLKTEEVRALKKSHANYKKWKKQNAGEKELNPTGEEGHINGETVDS